MNILFVTGVVHHKYGSLERHFVYLAAAARARGHVPWVLTDTTPDQVAFLDDLRAAGAQVLLHPFFGDLVDEGGRIAPRSLERNRAQAWTAALLQLLMRERFDVVHAHFTPPAHLALAMAAARRVPVRAWTLHSLPMVDGDGQVPARTKALLLSSGHLAHAVLAVSGAVRDAYAALGVPSDRLRLGHLGVDVAAFARHEPTRAVVRGRLGWGEDAIVVGTVSRAEPVKDLATLVAGFAAARQQDSRLRLLVVGGGSLERDLRAQAAALGIEADSHLLGYRNDVGDLLQAMDVFVMPSRLEGLSLGLIEAGACSLPLLGSEVGGIPEAMAVGESGWLFAPGDVARLTSHLLEMAANPQTRSAMGAAALADVQARHTVQGQASRLLDLYETKLHAPPS